MRLLELFALHLLESLGLVGLVTPLTLDSMVFCVQGSILAFTDSAEDVLDQYFGELSLMGAEGREKGNVIKVVNGR